jgi:hypothetical protein
MQCLFLSKSESTHWSFGEKINTFKEGFARNYDLASRNFKTANEE